MDDLANLAKEWSVHAKAACAYWRRIEANAPSDKYGMGEDADFMATRWEKLSDSPIAAAIYSMDLSPGERALAKSLRHPLTVEKFLLPGGIDRHQRKEIRASSISEKLKNLVLYGSKGVMKVFSTDEPFAGHGPSKPASMMRKMAKIHMGAHMGFIGAFGLFAIMKGAGAPFAAFGALAMGSAAGLGMSTVMMSMGLRLDESKAQKIMAMAWPELPSKVVREYVRHGYSMGGEMSFQNACPMGQEEFKAMRGAFMEISPGDDSNLMLPRSQWGSGLEAWIAPLLAACERADLEAQLPGSSQPRASTHRRL